MAAKRTRKAAAKRDGEDVDEQQARRAKHKKPRSSRKHEEVSEEESTPTAASSAAAGEEGSATHPAPDADTTTTPHGDTDGDAPPSDPLADLLPHHRKMIEDSGISPEVAAERGYRSITVKSDVLRLGFARYQCSTPTLYQPVRSVRGEVVSHQVRPDMPRQGRNGRIVKYETPTGSSVALDVHPQSVAALGDPSVPLVLTEGIRKGDSATTKGMCCIALIGVWNWRGRNDKGGLTALPDWEYVHLKGRVVYVAFDSDVTKKAAVYAALKRLKAFLEGRGARVKIVYLPPGENEAKCGLDDFLAQGKGWEDLVALAKDALPPKPPDEEPNVNVPIYRVASGGLVQVGYDKEGNEVLEGLTNFVAEIVANITEDDGQEQVRQFEILVRQEGVTQTIQVPAVEYPRMEWVSGRLGAKYIVNAGMGRREHARAAIQQLSDEIEERSVYTHTGWREIWGIGGVPGHWGYLHGGGCIGLGEGHPGVEVSLQPALQGFVLPAPPTGDALREAVRASLGMLRAARIGVSAPLLGATYCAALGNVDFSVHLEGLTGVGKSELASLSQRHFGRDMDARHLPGSWSSTANALEASAYYAKDTVYTVDDYVPQGSAADLARTQRDADRLLRGAGNRSGRQRMRADGSLRPSRAPRALIISTGEDVPVGQSLRARMFIIEMRKNDVDWSALTVCQQDAAAGKYAEAMSGFVAAIAPHRAGLEERIKNRTAELRTLASEQTSGSHKRTPDIAARLFVGVEYLLDFAQQCGAIDKAESAALRQDIWAAIVETAELQGAMQATSDPVDMFLRLVRSALAAGGAHISTVKGEQPEPALHDALGWRRDLNSNDLRAQGERIGWIEGSHLYLDGPAAFRAAQKFAGDSERISLTQRALGRRLQDRRLLLSTDSERHRLTVRRTFCGARVDALHLSASLFIELPQSPQSPRNGPGGHGEADFAGAFDSDRRRTECPTDPQQGEQEDRSARSDDDAPAWKDLGDGRGEI